MRFVEENIKKVLEVLIGVFWGDLMQSTCSSSPSSYFSTVVRIRFNKETDVFFLGGEEKW